MSFCSNCGAQNNPDVKFCAQCGTPLNGAAPVPPNPYTYGAPAVPGKGLGIASMVLGIISLVLFCIWYISVPCSIISAALGGASLSKAKQVGMSNGTATAGITCSCIALGLTILLFVLAAIGLAELGLSLSEIF